MQAEATADPLASQNGDRFKVLTLVASVYDVPMHDLAHAARGTSKAAEARQVAIYLAHTALEMTFAEAADAFGRTRSTAAHAVRKILEMRDSDPKVDQTLSWLETVLRTAKEIAR